MVLLQGTSARLPSTANLATGIRRPDVAALAPLVTAVAPGVSTRDAKWDLLLVCVAAYILTAVGRVHQLFPVLEMLRPAVLTGVLAIALYLLDQHQVRRFRHVLLSPTKWIVALLGWMV